MSGIVGIVNLDGAPVDSELLREMTEFLAFRGPDAQEVWSSGAIGFGHTMLRTTFEAADERQPASLDGEVWITADARVDARDDLLAELRVRGHACSTCTPDSELILQEYAAWGEECVEHFLGDFAFAIWDGRERKLFCARDHFGVKPFFYAQTGNSLVFSNTLNCVRMHPSVSDELNDLAIADFLLFDGIEDTAATSFAAIRRLPAAHTLIWTDGALRVKRYWTLPIEEELHYQRAGEYVENFLELLDTAVADRLRTDRVSVFMSGGMDSSTVAAAAKHVIARSSSRVQLRAHTVVYDRLFSDPEREFSGLVAASLGIPIHYLVADDYQLFGRIGDLEISLPEPDSYPLRALEVEGYRAVAQHARVVLTGDGGDPGVAMSLTRHLQRLMERRRWRRAAADLWSYFSTEGRFSRLYIRKRLEILLDRRNWQRLYPVWLNSGFEARLDLRRRWEEGNEDSPAEISERPEAYALLSSSHWPRVFYGYDPAVMKSAVEARHPFFDLRLMRFLLRLPALPWAADKTLFREAARGRLPERVRRRPKTPLVTDPVTLLVQRPESQWVDEFQPEDGLERYLTRKRVPAVAGEKDLQILWLNLRPIALNFWLLERAGIKYKKPQEETREFTKRPAPETTV